MMATFIRIITAIPFRWFRLIWCCLCAAKPISYESVIYALSRIIFFSLRWWSLLATKIHFRYKIVLISLWCDQIWIVYRWQFILKCGEWCLAWHTSISMFKWRWVDSYAINNFVHPTYFATYLMVMIYIHQPFQNTDEEMYVRHFVIVLSNSEFVLNQFHNWGKDLHQELIFLSFYFSCLIESKRIKP